MAVWDTDVTMGYWAHLGAPIWGLPPAPGVWDMGEFIMHRWEYGVLHQPRDPISGVPGLVLGLAGQGTRMSY